ncbi:MAG: hypothetical protein AB1861_19795 [Cyanobacteriota bacterium]
MPSQQKHPSPIQRGSKILSNHFQASNPKKAKLYTEEGLKKLGKLLYIARKSLKLGYRSFSNHMLLKTGYSLSEITLMDMEKAIRVPSWRTLAILECAEIIYRPDGTPYTFEEFCQVAYGAIDPTDPESPFFWGAEHGMKESTPKSTRKKREDMYQFTYEQMKRLKVLMEGSRLISGLDDEGIIQAATQNGIAEPDARLFYTDIVDENLRSHPISRIEAFLPLLLRVKQWKPLLLNQEETYANDFHSLIKDLEHVNDSAPQYTV